MGSRRPFPPREVQAICYARDQEHNAWDLALFNSAIAPMLRSSIPSSALLNTRPRAITLEVSAPGRRTPEHGHEDTEIARHIRE